MNLVLSKRAFAEIEKECLSYPLVETGGTLIGHRLGSEIVVPFVVGSGPDATRSPFRYTPDVEWQQKHHDDLFEKHQVNFVGSFHRHFGSFSLSIIDYHVALQILSDPEWDISRAIFVIVLVENDGIVIYPYHISKTNMSFELTTVGVVPDDDPLIKRVKGEQ